MNLKPSPLKERISTQNSERGDTQYTNIDIPTVQEEGKVLIQD